MAELRLSGVVRESIVDGPGIRFSVFAQGCPHACEGCHNPQTHSTDGGYLTDTQKLLAEIDRDPLLDGITLSGGEPFEQAEALAELARRVQERGLGVIVYTGYTVEELLEGVSERPGWQELLEETDILVDGRFEKEEMDLMLRFRGSKNQRVLDPAASLREERAVLTEWRL